jgi:hypothetical protein
MPPLTLIVCPLIHPPSCDIRKTTAPAMSSGLPNLLLRVAWVSSFLSSAVDLRDNFPGALQVNIADHDRGPGLRQLDRGGRANPGRAASHDHHFSLQSLIRHRQDLPLVRSGSKRMRYPTVSGGVQEATHRACPTSQKSLVAYDAAGSVSVP